MNTNDSTELKKVYAEVTFRLIFNTDDNFDIEESINELDFWFTDMTGNSDVIDAEIRDYNVYQVTDS